MCPHEGYFSRYSDFKISLSENYLENMGYQKCSDDLSPGSSLKRTRWAPCCASCAGALSSTLATRPRWRIRAEAKSCSKTNNWSSRHVIDIHKEKLLAAKVPAPPPTWAQRPPQPTVHARRLQVEDHIMVIGAGLDVVLLVDLVLIMLAACRK